LVIGGRSLPAKTGGALHSALFGRRHVDTWARCRYDVWKDATPWARDVVSRSALKAKMHAFQFLTGGALKGGMRRNREQIRASRLSIPNT
jgi:hypothetical protein